MLVHEGKRSRIVFSADGGGEREREGGGGSNCPCERAEGNSSICSHGNAGETGNFVCTGRESRGMEKGREEAGRGEGKNRREGRRRRRGGRLVMGEGAGKRREAAVQ